MSLNFFYKLFTVFFQLFHIRVCIVCSAGIWVFTANYLCSFWWWRFTGPLQWNIHPFHWQFSLSLLLLVVFRKKRENCWTWIVIQSAPSFSWFDNKTGCFKVVTTEKAVFVWYPVFFLFTAWIHFEVIQNSWSFCLEYPLVTNKKEHYMITLYINLQLKDCTTNWLRASFKRSSLVSGHNKFCCCDRKWCMICIIM